MKGVVFTEFLDYIESQHGILVSDQVITTSGIPEDCAHITSGTRSFGELRQLVGSAHAMTGKLFPEAELPHIPAEAVDENTIRFEYRLPSGQAGFGEFMLMRCSGAAS